MADFIKQLSCSNATQNLTDAKKTVIWPIVFSPSSYIDFKIDFFSTFRSFYHNPAQPGAYLVIIKMTYRVAFSSKKDVRNLRYFPGNYKTNKLLCSSILFTALSYKDSFWPCIPVYQKKKKIKKRSNYDVSCIVLLYLLTLALVI